MKDTVGEETLLVTGATGFVGSHLLDSLARTHPGAHFVLLARDASHLDARLAQAAETYALTDLTALSYTAVNADIAVHGLGLSDGDRKNLEACVDAVFHVAAQVNHLHSYETLRRANVESTLELMRLSTADKPKVINFVSTLGAAARRGADGRLAEDFPDATPLESAMGYFQTKWASERLLSQFHENGGKANIFRLGRIVGSESMGRCRFQDNQLFLLLKGVLMMGCAPDLERFFNLTPAPVASDIMALARFTHDGGYALNVFNDSVYLTWRDMIERLSELIGPIELVSFTEWQSRILDVDEANPIARLAPLYLRPEAEAKMLSSATNIHDYACQMSARIMDDEGLHYPDDIGALFDVHVRHMAEAGFWDSKC